MSKLATIENLAADMQTAIIKRRQSDEAPRRYALATDKDAEAGLIWSTGGVWSSSVPEESKLLTGPQADEFAARHPGATIVDVIVYRERHAAWLKAFNGALKGVERSTPEIRAAARKAGDDALRALGYSTNFNPCAV